MNKNRQNPKGSLFVQEQSDWQQTAVQRGRRTSRGYGHAAPDTASLLLEVVNTTPASLLLVPAQHGRVSRLERVSK